MNSFSWLNDLMVWLSRWIPRIVLVKAGESALWFGPKGRTRTLVPGLYIYWPITSEVTVMSARRRTLEMCGQVNGREVVSIVVTWRLVEPTAILTWNNPPANIDDRCAASLCRHYVDAIDTEALAEAILVDLQNEFGPAGIEIQRADVAQRAPIRAIRLMNDWATHEASTL